MTDRREAMQAMLDDLESCGEDVEAMTPDELESMLDGFLKDKARGGQ